MGFDRIMVAELDSIAQWDLVSSYQAPSQAVTEMSGMLRAALVLGGRVLVTDSMLLDGWYFLSLGPQGVAQQLGLAPTALPFAVIGVGDSLGDSLELKRHDQDFIWQSLTRTTALWTEEDLDSRWREWVEAAGRGDFGYERVGQQPVGTPVFRVQIPAEHRAGLHPASEDFLRRIESLAGRSAFFRLVHRERQQLLAETDAVAASQRTEELALLERHWHVEYSRHLARRNQANWVQFRAHSASDAAKAAPDAVSLRMPAAFVRLMQECTAGAFATIYSALGETQKKLLRKPSNGALQNLAFACSGLLEVPHRRRKISSAVARAIIAVAAIAAAVPGQQTEFFGVGTAWLTFGAAALATVPWSDVPTFFSLIKVEERTEIVFFKRP